MSVEILIQQPTQAQQPSDPTCVWSIWKNWGGSSTSIIALVFFKRSNTIRQRLVYPKDRTRHTQKNHFIYAVSCSEECADLYTGETKQPLNKRIGLTQESLLFGTGLMPFVYICKDNGHAFADTDVRILDREDRWFKTGVKEAIYVK